MECDTTCPGQDWWEDTSNMGERLDYDTILEVIFDLVITPEAAARTWARYDQISREIVRDFLLTF